jgi:hypothetical protein
MDYGTLLVQKLNEWYQAYSGVNTTSNAATTSVRDLVANGSITANAGGGTGTYHPEGFISVNTTVVGVGANTDYAYQNVATIPANTLRNTGDRLVVEYCVTLGTDANNKTYQCNFGYTSRDVTGFTGGVNIQTNATTSISDDVLVRTTVTRTGSNTFGFYTLCKFIGSTSTQGSAFTSVSSLDLTAALNMAIGIKNANSVANSPKVNISSVEYIPAPV